MPTPHRSLSFLALPLLAVAAFAQSWSQVTPSPANPAPSARNRAAMAYDAARGQALLFGGYDGTTTPRSDFWSFQGTSWQQLGGTVPAGRWGHGMVYDTRRERAVLFGGFQPSLGNPLPDALALQDTWEYDGFGWTQVTPTTRPSARGYFGFAYDPIRARSVLFGGAGPNTSYLQDTWEWNGTAWTLVNAPARPSIRRGPAMAFDMERAQMVLFGGGAFGTQFGDTWTYNGSTWTQRNPATSPPARWETTLAFDPLCGRTLLMGGTTFNYQTIFADSWNWDGVTWTQVTGTQPQARHGVSATFDLQAGRSMWFGGRDAAGFRSDLWAWNGGCPRTMSTVTPAVAGQTAQYRYSYPATAVNNPYFELWTLRNPNAFPLHVPGIVSVGLTRVDLFFVLAQNFGVLGASGQQNTVPFAIPNTNAVVGFTYDVQDVDIDVASDNLYWAGNDVEATVAMGAPVASFTATPTSGGAPLVVQFTDTSLFAASWQWDFENDGVIDSTVQNPTITYTAAGTYSVRLVATGPSGSNTLTQSNLIQVVPSPSFTATPTFGAAPLSVQFTDTTAFPVNSWQWDFQNDGVIDSTVQNPTFVYTTNGSYSVRLVVGTVNGPSTVIRSGLIAVAPPFGGSLNPALNMVAIAPGTFQMGSNATPGNPYFTNLSERPVHQVTLTQPFWMGRHEVTQAQYQAVMGSNPSYFQGASWPNAAVRPVEAVSWFNAVAYCDALSVQEAAAGRLPAGYEYRLPTEAEWEYCCRAGATTEFHYGATLVCGQANFGYSYHSGTFCSNPGGAETAVVGSYIPNAWGLYDMHGNVWEWCLDGSDGSVNYPAGPVADPYVPSPSSPDRVIRGGGWIHPSNYCRSATRYNDGPAIANRYYGFRVVCAPVQP